MLGAVNFNADVPIWNEEIEPKWTAVDANKTGKNFLRNKVDAAIGKQGGHRSFAMRVVTNRTTSAMQMNSRTLPERTMLLADNTDFSSAAFIISL